LGKPIFDQSSIPVSFTNIMRPVKGERMPLQATFDVFAIRVVLALGDHQAVRFFMRLPSAEAERQMA
jgi:hypothetical protein